MIVEDQSLTLDDNVRDKLMPILSSVSREPDFGNGRFVRNLIEQARMKQAGRLLAMDIDTVTTRQATMLIASDFEAPTLTRAKAMQRIGFDVA